MIADNKMKKKMKIIGNPYQLDVVAPSKKHA